jgi:hypothetical protein
MLKDSMKQYLSKALEEKKDSQIILFKEEVDYIERNQLMEDRNINLTENKSNSRFLEAYVERCNKETEEVIAEEEEATFLDHPLEYLQRHKNEFIYLESKWFELVGVDAVSLEVDDVFDTYSVLLGLKLQKKFQNVLKEQLSKQLHREEASFSLMFNQNDGLWDLNFALNYVDGFQEDLSIREAYQLVYGFIFTLLEAVEESQ